MLKLIKINNILKFNILHYIYIYNIDVINAMQIAMNAHKMQLIALVVMLLIFC